jgi:hypothetical protein
VCEDISGGQEAVAIPYINEVDAEPPQHDFVYAKQARDASRPPRPSHHRRAEGRERRRDLRSPAAAPPRAGDMATPARVRAALAPAARRLGEPLRRRRRVLLPARAGACGRHCARSAPLCVCLALLLSLSASASRRHLRTPARAALGRTGRASPSAAPTSPAPRTTRRACC